jgi:hypothetical protein
MQWRYLRLFYYWYHCCLRVRGGRSERKPFPGNDLHPSIGKVIVVAKPSAKSDLEDFLLCTWRLPLKLLFEAGAAKGVCGSKGQARSYRDQNAGR